MAVTSLFSRLAAFHADSRLRPHARGAVTAGAAIVLVFGGLLAFGMPDSLAEGGFFEELFGIEQPRHQHVAQPLYYAPREHGWRAGRRGHARHYAHHPFHVVRHARRARHHDYYARSWAPAEHPVARFAARRSAHRAAREIQAPVEREAYHPVAREKHHRVIHEAYNSEAPEAARPEAAPLASPTPLARRSVCVRTCDGYFFPVANLNHKSDIATHQAICNSLCPDSETKLFVIPNGSENIDEAKEAHGDELYSQLMAKIKSSDAKPAACGCHSTAGAPVDNKAVLNDPTLRAGDTVVTNSGVRVFKGGAYPYKSTDFLSLAESRDVPVAKRGALAAIDRVVKTPRGRVMLATERHRERRDRRQRRSELDLAPIH